jgi:hypothetical protein
MTFLPFLCYFSLLMVTFDFTPMENKCLFLLSGVFFWQILLSGVESESISIATTLVCATIQYPLGFILFFFFCYFLIFNKCATVKSNLSWCIFFPDTFISKIDFFGTLKNGCMWHIL